MGKIRTDGTASPNPRYPQTINNVTGDVNISVVNKNLFNRDKTPTEIWQLTKENYQNGIKLTSTANSGVCYIKYEMWFNYNELKNVYLSFNKTGTGRVNLYFYDSNNQRVKSKVDQQASFGLIDIPATAVKFEIFFYGSTTNIGDITIFDDIQLEIGTVGTEYVEYKLQTKTFPLGTEKLMLGDYLADDGIHHVRGQIVIDGSEAWSDFSYTNGDNNFRVQKVEKLPNILTPPTNPANLICNYFKAVNRDDAYIKSVVGIAQYGSALGTIFISAPISILQNQTMQGWKDWLAEHNLIVEYLLQEEEIVPYTQEQQTVYDPIKKATSYEEQTNVSSSNETSPIFVVEAYQSTKLLLAELLAESEE